MILCNTCEEELACCDFCKYYDFNGDDEGRYTGDGYCNKKKQGREPGEECDEFHCKQAKKMKITRKTIWVTCLVFASLHFYFGSFEQAGSFCAAGFVIIAMDY